jgi:hypothetical protein
MTYDVTRRVVYGYVVEGVEVMGKSGLHRQICHRYNPQMGITENLDLHRKSGWRQPCSPDLIKLFP